MLFKKWTEWQQNNRSAKGLFATILLFATTTGAIWAANWPTFDWNSARTGAPTVSMGLMPAMLSHLERLKVSLDGTVDGSPIYLHDARIDGEPHDAFFVTTTYGKTIAVDASSGKVLWEFTPKSYSALAGSYRITTATPVAGPERRFIYAAAPDGKIRKLAVSDGRVLWATSITRLPEREKIAAPLSFSDGHVIAATDGYIGDAPPYQGHVALIDSRSGRLVGVWNSLCSRRTGLIAPSECSASDSGIWGRAGVVVQPRSGNLFFATGNGPWNGTTNWGDSVMELNPTAARILGNYTPRDTLRLDQTDADLGSSSPVLLGGNRVLQGGKDGWLRLLDWSHMRGIRPHLGGARSRVATPAAGRLFTAPAVWRAQGKTWIFVADRGGTEAFTLSERGLARRWQSRYAGTSPVAVDGMLFVYDPYGGLHVYDPTSGRLIRTLQCGRGHWNSPIVVDGRIALPTGNANTHSTHGFLDIWQTRPNS